jgi:hypothetical protein
MGLKGRSPAQGQLGIYNMEDALDSALKSPNHLSFSHTLLIIIYSKFTSEYEFILHC